MDAPLEKPIFMIGMPRSGTTVISEAISLHPDLGWFSNYLGRMPYLPIVALLDRVTGCKAWGWRLRGKKHQAGGLLSFLKRALPHTDEAFKVWQYCCGDYFLRDYLINRQATEAEKICLRGYVKKVLRYQNKKRFFTKLTGPPRIAYLKSIFPDAIFIHAVRDPRAVVASLLKVDFWQEGGGLKEPWWVNGLPREYVNAWEERDRHPVALAAVQWKRVVELTFEEKKLLRQGCFFQIRYEDFVSDPHGTLSGLFASLGLSDAVEAHNYLATTGNIRNMNFKYSKILSAEEIAIVETLVKPVAQKTGYSFEDIVRQ